MSGNISLFHFVPANWNIQSSYWNLNLLSLFIISAQSCLTLCDPMDYSLPGSCIHGILQARILEWVVISFSRGSFPPQGLNPCLLRPLHWPADSLPLTTFFQRGEWKSWLKAQHSENEVHGIQAHHFMANRWGNSERLYFFGLQDHYRCYHLQSLNEKTLTPWKDSYDQPRQHIKKQRHYFANKGPSSQGCGFSSSRVWMWELDCKQSWAPKNWCF